MLEKLSNLEFEKVEISQKEISFSERPEYTNKFTKLLFFLLHEGIFLTWAKVKSKNIENKIRKKYITHIKVFVNQVWYHNISVQSHCNKEDFIVENNFFRKDDFNISAFDEDALLKAFTQYQRINIKLLFNEELQVISLKVISQRDNNKIDREKGVFLFGLGDYARVYIAKHLKGLPLVACVDHNPDACRYFVEKIGFHNYYLLPKYSYNDIKTTHYPLVIISTYHSDHTTNAKEVYETNPNSLIFIEKPPCVTLDDLKTLVGLMKKNAKIEVGFNRRFIPWNIKIREFIRDKKVIINLSIKEVLIHKNHWYYWENQGTRITGNLVHWIDLCTFWISSLPLELVLLNKPSEENIAFSILYENGSIANFIVSDLGNSLRGVQEYIEIRTEEEDIRIYDYLKIVFTRKNGKKKTYRKIIRNKGHQLMYQHIINVFKGKSKCLYTVKDLVITTYITYKATEMFKTGKRNLKIDKKELQEFITF